jgi:hypothetical protein
MRWVTEALRQSHDDTKRHHEAAIARLHSEYNRLQTRIDGMYVDKLDGRIDSEFFDRKACEWRKQQELLLRSVEEHQAANQTYLEEGVRLLELAQRAHKLFQEQEPREKRRLLNFLLSNCSWKGRELTAVFRQPFDLLVDANSDHRQPQQSDVPSDAGFENWLGGLDSNQDNQIQNLMYCQLYDLPAGRRTNPKAKKRGRKHDPELLYRAKAASSTACETDLSATNRDFTVNSAAAPGPAASRAREIPGRASECAAEKSSPSKPRTQTHHAEQASRVFQAHRHLSFQQRPPQ